MAIQPNPLSWPIKRPGSVRLPGEVEVRPDDVECLTVSIAKRVCVLAGRGEVFVPETVKLHLVGSGIATSEQGSHVLKGVPEEWRLLAIEG